MNSIRHLRKAVAVVAVLGAALTAAIGVAGPASAASEWNAMIPFPAPKIDLAQGALFPTAARDSSGISYAESWKFTPAGDGSFYITNRHWKDGTTEMRLDIQAPGGPSNPGFGAPVGTAPVDGSSSQRWIVDHKTFGGVYTHTVITNKLSGYVLFWNGGSTPFTQKTVASSGGDYRFLVKNL